jgi:hypothetical protein
MGQEEQAAKEEKRARRKEKAKKVARIVSLPVTCLYVCLFFLVARTGYLSWIGFLVGLAYVTPGVIGAFAGFTGRPRLEGFFSWLNFGMPILLGLAVGLAIVWPVEDDGSEWKPYRFAEELAAIEAERAIPDEDNAALHCQTLLTNLDPNDEPDFFLQDTSLHDKIYGNAWNGAEYPEVAQWIDGYSQIVDELVRASEAGTFRWPLQAYTYDGFTVPYKPLRRGVESLIAWGNRNLGEGRLDDAITEYFCVIDIADDLREQRMELDFTVGAQFERNALWMIRRVLVQHDLSVRHIARIAHRLPTTDEMWPTDGRAFLQAEKLRYMNLLGRLYEVNEKGDVRFTVAFRLSLDYPVRDDRWLRIYCPMSMPLDPTRLENMAARYFARFEYLLQSDWLPPVAPKEEGFWDGGPKMAVNFHRWWAEASFFREEDYVETRYRCAMRVAGRRGTWLVLGLRQYHEAHGQWPEELNEIAAYAPAEAFSDPTNGGPFVYVREGDHFRLYSRGANGIDENGRDGYWSLTTTKDDDIPIWPPPEPKPQSTEPNEDMMRQLKEIYGDRFQMVKPEDPNDV